MCSTAVILSFFFFNDTATTEIYTLSLHDALPIYPVEQVIGTRRPFAGPLPVAPVIARSEEHTSELQSPCNLVCRLLLEKKKKKSRMPTTSDSTTSSIASAHLPHASPCAAIRASTI